MTSSVSANSNDRSRHRRALRGIGLAVLGATTFMAVRAEAQTLRVGGFVQLDRRISPAGDSLQIADFYNVFRPELTANYDGAATAVVSLDVRFYDFTSVRSTDDLADAGRHFPNTLTVWEAYVHLAGVPLAPLDVTVGKQRIQWGSADGLNPTDRLNAYDLTDLTDFTARVPTWAARADYYLSDDWRVEAVWAPTAHAPLLPGGAAPLLGGSALPSFPGPVSSWEQHFEPPASSIGSGQVAVRASGRVGIVDVSASYFDGFDGIPIADRLLLVDVETASDPPRYDGHVWSRLPRIRSFGVDFSTEVGGIGVWGEGALVSPRPVERVSDIVTGGDTAQSRDTTLSDRPYATWTLGGDHTFPGGWYLNLQWAHGLFLEQGAGRLHDYLAARVERPVARQSVVFAMEGVLEVARWSEWSRNLGVGFLPKIEFSPLDNITASLGAFIVAGGGASLFGAWGDADQIYLRLRAAF